MRPVIDFHVHISRSEHEHPWVMAAMAGMTRQPLEKLVANIDSVVRPEVLPGFLAENHVDYAVALAEVNPIVTGTADNDYTAGLCREANEFSARRGGAKLIPFCSINPFLTADLPGELERCVNELGCKGLKLYPTYQHFAPNDARLYPLYARAQELGIPVLVHTGSSLFKGARMKYGDPLFLDDVAVDFPDLTVVMAHSGRGFWYDRAYFLAKLHPNLYMEIAGLPPKRLLAYFPEFERLAHKIIFGSDWPGIPSIADNIAAVRALPISDESKALILGGNAARVLGLDE